MRTTTHPQFNELVERLRAFLAAPVGHHGGVLHVCNSAGRHDVEFYDPEVFDGGWARDDDGEWMIPIPGPGDPGPEFNPTVGRKFMRFLWLEFDFGEPESETVERWRPVAERLGVAPPRLDWMENLLGGEPIPFILDAAEEVHDAETAARLCLRVHEEVFGLRDEDWLWITDIAQPEDWPSPLPKPDRWPPTA